MDSGSSRWNAPSGACLVLLAALAAPSPAEAQSGPAAVPPPPPADQWVTGAGRGPDIRAQLSPHRQTVLSSELAGKIVDLPLKEGDTVKEGQVLVGLDCAEHKARLDRSRAQEEAARRRMEVASRLEKLDSISQSEIADATAQLAMSRAETALSKVYVDRCVIAAPFPGRIAERHVQRYQYVAQGEPLLALIDDGRLELEMIVPSAWLTWLAPGQIFEIRVDEVGRSYPADVTRIGARIDPISQSVKVFGRLTGDQTGLLAGMSGNVVMPVPAAADQRAGEPKSGIAGR